MNLGDIGEFGFIERIARIAKRAQGRGVVLGIGDDAALLRTRQGEDLAVSSDSFTDGVHFQWNTESPRRVGARALGSALSDLAAMGARPLGLTMALAMPTRTNVVSSLQLVRGLIDAGVRWSCPLVGGNLTRAREISMSLTVLGALDRGRSLRRDGARLGARIFVTGVLGRAALARARLEAGQNAIIPIPEPRLKAGRTLLGMTGIQACIDLSDGLLSDLNHILHASGVGAVVDSNALPRPHGFDSTCRKLGRESNRILLSGGEDYELLFVASPRAPSAERLTKGLGVRVTEIGKTAKGGLEVLGAALSGNSGWRHF